MKDKELWRAVNVYDAMLPHGIKPDLISYSALISAREKGKELRLAVNGYEAIFAKASSLILSSFNQRL